MHRPLLVAAIFLAAMARASAADMPAYTKAPTAAAPDWTGFFYAGASLGARWSDTGWTTTGIGPAFGPPPANAATAAVTSFDSATVRPGGYFGYLRRIAPAWVVGLEGDIAWGDSNKTVAGIPGTSTNVGALALDAASVKEEWDASLRGRLGFLVTPTVLLYGTGGAAWQSLAAGASCAGAPGSASWCSTALSEQSSWTKAGWTAGGGIEAKLWRNWLGRVEYRYADYGTINHVFFAGTPASEVAVTEALKTHSLLFGLAYEFGVQNPQ
ncbi:MAG: outer membrane protein [Xanthobacteraceae bacterium]